MVIGFLASEGIIRKYEDIDDIWVQEKEGFVHVTTAKVNPYYEQMQNKRYITSCCGMSRQVCFANDALSAKKMNGVHVQVAAEDCFRLMKEMQQSAETFHHTGGVHNACNVNYNGISVNAVIKLFL